MTCFAVIPRSLTGVTSTMIMYRDYWTTSVKSPIVVARASGKGMVYDRRWNDQWAAERSELEQTIGRRPPDLELPGPVIHVPCRPPPSLLRLWEHLAIKLVFNTISTATAARLGRLRGNWMAFVETTNKKLIDRGTRLVAELCGLDYTAACIALHATMAEMAAMPEPERKKHSPVALTVERTGLKRG